MVTIENPIKHTNGQFYVIGTMVLINCKPNDPDVIWTIDKKPIKPYFISETEEIIFKDNFLAMNGWSEWMIDNYDVYGLEFTKPNKDFSNMDQLRWPHMPGEFKVIATPKDMPNSVKPGIESGSIKNGYKTTILLHHNEDQHPDWRPSYNDPDNSGLATIEWYTTTRVPNDKIVFL